MPSLPLDKPSCFSLDVAGVIGLLGGDDALSAMIAVHVYGNRRWLGWYNTPGSFQMAKHLASFAKSASFHNMFCSKPSSKPLPKRVQMDPTSLLGLDSCKGSNIHSDTIMEETDYMTQLSMKERATCDSNGKVVPGRGTQPIENTIPELGPTSPQLPRHLLDVKTTDVTVGGKPGVAAGSGSMNGIMEPRSTGQVCELCSPIGCSGTILEDGSNYHTENRFPNDLTNLVTRDGHDPFASGGFADIYRGILHNNGKFTKVAIKAIKIYSGKEGDFAKKQKRLWREIDVWLDLRHINIVPLLGTAMEFGRFPAMVCPWVENGPLTSYLEDHYDSLSVIEIIGLLNDVASGLQYLHSRSVVHGDLSGSNVLICKDGRAYITDFGMSMLLTKLGESIFATSRHAQGTLRWAAPELLNLKLPEDGIEEESPHLALTTQSDIYSFGSIMLQILSGKVPYHYYKRNWQVMHAVSTGMTPRRPKSALVTEHRWMFIQRCWSSVDVDRSRPSSDEIVEFIDQELVGASWL